MPDLSRLLELIGGMGAYRRVLDELKARRKGRAVVLGAARPYLAVSLHDDLRLPLLVVTPRPEDSKKLYEQLLNWCPEGVINLFPEPDALPYERLSPDAATELERVRVLTTLAGAAVGETAPLVVASAPALMGRVPAGAAFAAAGHTVELGMNVSPLRLLERWEKLGYRREGVVAAPGTMSQRGGIVDVFPPTSELPARLEFFGNTIDGIRLFDPATQRSKEKAASVAVGPAAELLAPRMMDKHELEKIMDGLDLSVCHEDVRQQFRQDIAMMLEGQWPPLMHFYAPLFNKHSLLDYLPPESLIVLDDPEGIEQAVAELDEEAGRLRAEKLERGELPGNFPRPYFTWEELSAEIEERRCLALDAWGIEETRLDFLPAPGFAGQLPPFLKKTKELLDEKQRVIIVSNQAERLSELLDGEDIVVAPVDDVKQVPGLGGLVLVHGSLDEGWVMDDTCLFTDAEIFGFVKQRRYVKRRLAPHREPLTDMNPGDYVVHVEHGIGKFGGVTMLRTAGIEKEYLILQYAAGDTLYVPADQIDRVGRYVGAGERMPALSRLGTQEWHRTKQRAREAAELLARELLALYAAREVVPGYAFSRDTVWQQELEASFPYVETPDQMEAQRQVKEDMEKPKPMDRLVCGDVGYGKTEVAVRAAFKAVMEGKQAAVLVPTTVLAQQHYTTFSERFEAFPVRVEVLSRFRSHTEQAAVLEGLYDGTVDVCIGTHRLLQKDVKFKDMGLLIIDEEQRFGVGHKEYLKKMRQEVDVLTLSATPIPRTLHMSLAGVRDMCVMETTPETRLPIKTYVAEYNEHLVREAILREMERNGQVFFVHNRVQSINMVDDGLRELVPEARIAVAHGQMPEDELETVMAAFGRDEYDVIVCTTIIESGLDMPNVNTVIVNRADKFGLTQLYQLRGRVGRGANLAYAYFLYEGGKKLTPAAHQRLRTIYEATELGAGFGIAMKDLEIRGAGNLLGARQSGHITAVGFSLYTRLLAEAVEERKARIAGDREPKPRLPEPTVDLPLDAYIPEHYVSDVATRMELYRQLSQPGAADGLDELTQDYHDRFGTPPPEVQNLFYAVRIKNLAAKAGIETVATQEGQIVLRRFQNLPFDRKKLEPVLRDEVYAGRTLIRINYRKLGRSWKRVLEEVLGGLLT